MTVAIQPQSTTRTATERRIVGLPREWESRSGEIVDLSLVPESPTNAHDPNRYALQDAWKRWHHEIRLYRVWVVEQVAAIPELAEIELRRCAADPLYFMAVYAHIYEVRQGQGMGTGFLPAIPFPFQYDLVRWLQRRMDTELGAGANGFISKSRDMGATWECVLFVLHQFLFTEPFIAEIEFGGRIGGHHEVVLGSVPFDKTQRVGIAHRHNTTCRIGAAGRMRGTTGTCGFERHRHGCA